jgi:hypothetical protein
MIKRDWLEKDDFQSHIELAEWCLRHGLLARAADQVLIAGLREPSHARLRELDRRLTARISPDPSPDSKVVSYTPAVSAHPAEALDLEPILVQQFTTTIQPILFNRCASFQCHGGGSSAYRLIRPGSGQVPTSRMTQRNLRATLVYVDRMEPEHSRLMAMAQQPHGRVSTAIFHEKTGNQLELLTGWVRRLRTRPVRPAPVNEPSSTWQPPTAEWPPRTALPATPPSTGTPPGSAPAADSTEAPLPTGPAPAPALPSSDPFDPAAFNERFHPGR